MNRLFVFGIGGSGERVMRSLVMALAGGMPIDCDTIQPVFIDSDEKSRALMKAQDLIKAYEQVRKIFDVDASYVKDEFVQKNSMFHVKIEQPVLMNISGTDVESLKKLVQAENLSVDMKKEFDALYSEKSQNMKLSWGFVGNPSIGAVVLNQMLESDTFKNLNINSKDGVFIISSVFGGTGAAGFPLLVNKIRDMFDGNYEGLKVGALSLFPYFDLRSVQDESMVAKGLQNYDVNDREFSTKTKAALAYYDNHVKALSSMYYLGSGRSEFRSKFPKFKGGEKQDNPACMLELLGAKSVAHFTYTAKGMTNSIANENFKDFTTYYEYFIKKEPSNGAFYDLKSIDPDVKFREVFVRLQLLKFIWKDCVPGYIATKGNQWSISIGMTKGGYNNMMGKYLDSFFDLFEQWKKELNHDYHSGGFKFRFFDDTQASSSEQNYITQRFYPRIDHQVSGGFFNRETQPQDPNILGKMQSIVNKNIGDGFKSDEVRQKFAFYTSLYAIEHIINDSDKNRCINLEFGN